MWEKIKSKLTSRKFWIALIGVVAGTAQLFGADGDTVSVICGACLTLVPSVVYVITEGRLDEAGAKRLASSLSDAFEIVSGEKEPDVDKRESK